MKYLLSNRQHKTLHGGRALLVCVPAPDRTSLEGDRARDTAAAREALAADYVFVIDAVPALVVVRQWTGPRNQPSGLGDILGEIERDPAVPLRPGYVRTRQIVLLTTVHSALTVPTGEPEGPVWPADVVPDGATEGIFEAGREAAMKRFKDGPQSRAAGIELLREGQERGEYGPGPNPLDHGEAR